MSTMVTGTRVNGRGKVTGQADLAVEREGDVVYVKLGLIRLAVDSDQWSRVALEAAAEGACITKACSCLWVCAAACNGEGSPHYPDD